MSTWENLKLIVEIEIAGVKFQRRKDGKIYHWGEWDNFHNYWKILSNATKWPDMLSYIASLESVMEAVDIIAEMESTGEESEEEMYLIGCHNRHRQKYPKVGA